MSSRPSTTILHMTSPSTCALSGKRSASARATVLFPDADALVTRKIAPLTAG
jgi:hypothetical protein